MNRKVRIIDWYGRRFRNRLARILLRVITVPVGRQLSTDEVVAFESSRMISLAFAFVERERIEGDYVEFGTSRGRTFVEAWRSAELHRLDSMRFVAFDSFEGLPAPSGVDAGGPFQAGQFAASRAEFERTLRSHKVPADRVDVVEGPFERTLAPGSRESLPPRPVAVAWVDCDLYESAVPVLDFLTDRISDGAILVFDDWFTFKAKPDRGEQRACREWLEANPQITLVEYRDFHWDGKAFIVHREDS